MGNCCKNFSSEKNNEIDFEIKSNLGEKNDKPPFKLKKKLEKELDSEIKSISNLSVFPSGNIILINRRIGQTKKLT